MILLPFVWMLLGSFKTQAELAQRPITWWPENITFENYGSWFGELNIGGFFFNSAVVSVITVAAT